MDQKKEKTISDSDDSLLHAMDMKDTNTFFSSKTIISLVVVMLLGIGVGYYFAKNGTPTYLSNTPGSVTSNGNTMVVGSNDTKTFKDMAEGLLKEGGIEGEGQYHLVRPGGDSQNVYLTSSFVDLSQFVGKKIKVWGETQTAQKAGWLMDVGRVEVPK